MAPRGPCYATARARLGAVGRILSVCGVVVWCGVGTLGSVGVNGQGGGIQCRAGSQLEAPQCTSYSDIALACSAPFLRCSNGLLSSVNSNCTYTAEQLRQCIVSAVTDAAVTDTGIDLSRTADVQLICQEGRIFLPQSVDCELVQEFNFLRLGLPKSVSSTTTTSTISTTSVTATRTTETVTATTATFTTGHIQALRARSSASLVSPVLSAAATVVLTAAASCVFLFVA
eukprot:m.52758 g.52758  ORF g.52758 m.52758 type:complete len:229 (+) comp16580_c0_seq1:87-773(+)